MEKNADGGGQVMPPEGRLLRWRLLGLWFVAFSVEYVPRETGLIGRADILAEAIFCTNK